MGVRYSKRMPISIMHLLIRGLYAITINPVPSITIESVRSDAKVMEYILLFIIQHLIPLKSSIWRIVS